MIRVLFVCLGNICRSPLGEGIFRHHVSGAGLEHQFEIDSAGTGDWHVGQQPHHGSQLVARQRGLDLSGQRARQILVADLASFDYVVAMDSQNHRDILALVPRQAPRARVVRMMEFAPHLGHLDVPDPYFGAQDGFETVYDMIDAACAGLLAHIARERGLTL